jgi:hypothetical protein
MKNYERKNEIRSWRKIKCKTKVEYKKSWNKIDKIKIE